MVAFIDSHTHNIHTSNPFSIINLPVNEVESVLSKLKHHYFSIGVHPWNVHTTDPSILDVFEQLLSDRRIRAVGECGFDRNAKASFKEQGYFFERQVALSEKYERPLIIHCVAAYNEIIRLRNKFKPAQKWMIHGFRGKPELAKQLLNAGFILSFGEKFNPATVIQTPLEKLCVETDDSLYPIEEIYKKIATLKNCRQEELNAACQLLKLYVC